MRLNIQLNQIRNIDFQHFDTGQNPAAVSGQGWKIISHAIQFLSGLILVPASLGQGSAMRVNMTTPPESRATGVNVGDLGQVVSTLRPTGKARFGDAIVDVVAGAEFIDKGAKVEIIEIHGNRVVVKKRTTEDE